MKLLMIALWIAAGPAAAAPMTYRCQSDFVPERVRRWTDEVTFLTVEPLSNSMFAAVVLGERQGVCVEKQARGTCEFDAPERCVILSLPVDQDYDPSECRSSDFGRFQGRCPVTPRCRAVQRTAIHVSKGVPLRVDRVEVQVAFEHDRWHNLVYRCISAANP